MNTNSSEKKIVFVFINRDESGGMKTAKKGSLNFKSCIPNGRIYNLFRFEKKKINIKKLIFHLHHTISYRIRVHISRGR